MKKILLLAAAAFAAVLTVSAQEPSPFQTTRPDSLRNRGFSLPDSLAHLSPWRQEYRKSPAGSRRSPPSR